MASTRALDRANSFPEVENPDEDFRVSPGETRDELVADYLRTCERACTCVADCELDDVVTTRGVPRSTCGRF